MKGVFVFISALILVANAQDSKEIAKLVQKITEEFCGDENLQKPVTDCYNSVPQRMLDPVFECAGESYVTGEEIATAVCSGEIEMKENMDEETQKECIDKKYKEAALTLEEDEREAIKTSCEDLQEYVEKSGMIDILRDVVNNANGDK